MAILSLQDMIEDAYERVQVDPRSGYDYRSARRSLDILISDWSNRGLNMWQVEEQSYVVSAGNPYVQLGAEVFDVMDAVIRDTSVTPNFDLALDRMSPTDWLSIPYKTMEGTPSRYMVTRTASSVAVTVWQVPTVEMRLIVNQLQLIPSVSGYTSPLEIPERFQAAMISGLAFYLAQKRQPTRVAELRALYEDDFERAANEERDRSAMFIVPQVNSI